MAICRRCGKQTNVTTMSYFNTDIICMECDEKERKHSEFKAAQAREEREVKAGNYNFGGVGKPSDL